MALYNSPDIKLCNGLELVRAYVDDVLIVSNINYVDYLNKVKIVLKKLNALKVAGIKINS